MTPRDVSLRYSNGLVLEVVLRNGYKNSGMWAVVQGAELISKVVGTCARRKRTVEEQLPRFRMRSDTLQ